MRACRKVGVSIVLFVALSGLVAATAYAASPVLNLGPINPSPPGWGTPAQYSVYLSQNGRPVRNASLECWFSGTNGRFTRSWFVTTNNEGRATFLKSIPRDWKDKTNWVNLNVACNSVGAYKDWRIRGR